MGSLFSGIGGLDLGLERAGWTVRWQVESDPKARAVLARHWPHVPRYADVRTVHADDLGPVDLVCGGFPCQPFSSASRGRRAGIADTRWLWPEMCRLVSALRPAWVLGENVTHFDGAGLEQMVSDLEAIGYEVGPPLEVPACAFGFDHRRPRLWILGYADRDGQSGVSVDAAVAGLPRYGGDAGGVGAADGIPSRMDRLGMLGNAALPQIAEWLGRRLIEQCR